MVEPAGTRGEMMKIDILDDFVWALGGREEPVSLEEYLMIPK